MQIIERHAEVIYENLRIKRRCYCHGNQIRYRNSSSVIYLQGISTISTALIALCNIGIKSKNLISKLGSRVLVFSR